MYTHLCTKTTPTDPTLIYILILLSAIYIQLCEGEHFSDTLMHICYVYSHVFNWAEPVFNE